MKDIWINTKLTYWFGAYWLARAIRPLFNWGKPISFVEFVNEPRRSLIEVVLA